MEFSLVEDLATPFEQQDLVEYMNQIGFGEPDEDIVTQDDDMILEDRNAAPVVVGPVVPIETKPIISNSPSSSPTFVDRNFTGQWDMFKELTFTTCGRILKELKKYGQDYHQYLSFRHFVSNLIEVINWSCLNEAEAKRYIAGFVEELNKIRSGDNTSIPFDVRVDLENLHKYLRGQFSTNPMEFMNILQKMLLRERDILRMAESVPPAQNGLNMEGRARLHQLSQELENIEKIVLDAANQLQSILSEIENLHHQTNGNIQILDNNMLQIANPEQQQFMQTLIAQRSRVVGTRQRLITEYHQNCLVGQLHSLLQALISEIQNWKAHQAFKQNGIHDLEPYTLDELENCCRRFARNLGGCLDHAVKLQGINLDTSISAQQNMLQLQKIIQDYETMIGEIIRNALIIEQQPPQVLQKGKKFVCKIRHLVSDGLAVHEFPFETAISLITSDTARSILNGNNNLQIKESGEIQNNKVMSTFMESSRQVVARMGNLSLVKTDEERGKTENVANEKLCMVFRSFIPVQLPSMNKVTIVAQALSLPVVVITHGKQEADAEATIFWDNAFSDLIREPFATAQYVKLYELLDRLNLIWIKKCTPSPVDAMDSMMMMMTQEGRGLDSRAKKFLTEKLLVHCKVNQHVVGNHTGAFSPYSLVSWGQFQRDNISVVPKQNYSFWKYFYSIMKLIMSPQVNPHWNAGQIEGFINKDDTVRLLEYAPSGTFLFRFTNSELGSVSISCQTDDSKTAGKQKVVHFLPDNIKSFRDKQSLPEVVKTMKKLKFLYPNIPKEQIYGPVEEAPPTTNHNGYVPK